MRKTTKGHGLMGAVVITVAVAGVMLLLAVGLLRDYLGGSTNGAATVLVAVYVVFVLAVAVGVIAALVQRWREVKGGEEDEARKY